MNNTKEQTRFLIIQTADPDSLRKRDYYETIKNLDELDHIPLQDSYIAYVNINNIACLETCYIEAYETRKKLKAYATKITLSTGRNIYTNETLDQIVDRMNFYMKW